LDLVLRDSGGVVRDYGLESDFPVERKRVRSEEGGMTDFFKGIIAGVVASVILFGALCAIRYCHNRDKEMLEYAEKQIEIEELREDYGNRDPVEFLEVPGVRGAADDAADEFRRKRDEAIQRIRSRYPD
jgi:hypothetical protein